MCVSLPQQNLPMGCLGLARLPNSISLRWESDGRASWYSAHQRERHGQSIRGVRVGTVTEARAWKKAVVFNIGRVSVVYTGLSSS